MRIDIVAIGSRGDVQPNVALGVGLQREGHQVRMVTLNGCEELVRGRGLQHLSIGADPRDIARTAEGRGWVEHRAAATGNLRGLADVAAALIQSGTEAYWDNSDDVDALIVTPMGLLIGVHLAERLRIPLIRSNACPFEPTCYDWNGRRTVATRARGTVARVTWDLCFFLLWNRLRKVSNAVRRLTLGLPPLSYRRQPYTAIHGKPIPALDAYSPAIVPRPPDWGSWIHVTGYWFLDDPPGWAPSTELVDFLQTGTPPVFVGFGSTPFPDPAAATDLVVRALSRAGMRGVVVAGTSGLATGRLSDTVLSVTSVPHKWLFRHVSAVVHHGGSGVTAEALRAGLPAVVVPIFADQPFWGRRVFELGAGPRPIPAKELTDVGLANAVRLTANTEMRRRAAALGDEIRAENGIARAIEAVHQHAGARVRTVRAS